MAEPHTKEAMAEAEEADVDNGELEEEEEEGESDEVGDPIFHTTWDVYRLIQAMLRSVRDNRGRIMRLEKVNNKIAKNVEQQTEVIFERQSTIQRLSQELEKQQVAPQPN